MFCNVLCVLFYIGATKSAEMRHQLCGEAPPSLRSKLGEAPPSLREGATKSAGGSA